MVEAKNGTAQSRKESPRRDVAETETLNFKVSTTFKKEFKGYAVNQGITMVELLREGFELSKQKRKQNA